MDIEDDIRVLQLDSSEDANVNANAEDSKPQEVEQVDKMEEVKYQSNSASEDIEEEREDNKKRHLNFVFIGHVDAGKSTTGGQILFLSGRVDDRTIQKYEKEAKDKSRESWLPIIDKFKDMGTVVMGKVESGSVSEGDNLLVMPNKAQVKVTAIYCDEDKARRAGPGENLRIRLSGIEEEDILSGFVLSSVVKPIPAVSEFVAQLQILELLDNAIFTAG